MSFDQFPAKDSKIESVYNTIFSPAINFSEIYEKKPQGFVWPNGEATWKVLSTLIQQKVPSKIVSFRHEVKRWSVNRSHKVWFISEDEQEISWCWNDRYSTNHYYLPDQTIPYIFWCWDDHQLTANMALPSYPPSKERWDCIFRNNITICNPKKNAEMERRKRLKEEREKEEKDISYSISVAIERLEKEKKCKQTRVIDIIEEIKKSENGGINVLMSNDSLKKLLVDPTYRDFVDIDKTFSFDYDFYKVALISEHEYNSDKQKLWIYWKGEYEKGLSDDETIEYDSIGDDVYCYVVD
jgi:hypothetical protein